MIDETEMTPKPPTVPVDASIPQVTTKVSTQTETVSQGPEVAQESQMAAFGTSCSVRSIIALSLTYTLCLLAACGSLDAKDFLSVGMFVLGHFFATQGKPKGQS